MSANIQHTSLPLPTNTAAKFDSSSSSWRTTEYKVVSEQHRATIDSLRKQLVTHTHTPIVKREGLIYDNFSKLLGMIKGTFYLQFIVDVVAPTRPINGSLMNMTGSHIAPCLFSEISASGPGSIT